MLRNTGSLAEKKLNRFRDVRYRIFQEKASPFLIFSKHAQIFKPFLCILTNDNKTKKLAFSIEIVYSNNKRT